MAKRIVGIVLVVFGALSLIGAIAVVAIFGFSGNATSPEKTVNGNGTAIVWDIGKIKGGAQIGRLVNSLALDVRSVKGTPIFIGIGATDQVNTYLRDVAIDHVTTTDFTSAQLAMLPRPGTRIPPSPADQTFWVAKAIGTGDQQIAWDIASGDWKVVVMNAEPSPGVSVIGKGTLKIPFAPWAALILGLLGAGMVIGGIFLIRAPTVRRDPA